jgi:hypothetical protein
MSYFVSKMGEKTLAAIKRDFAEVLFGIGAQNATPSMGFE